MARAHRRLAFRTTVVVLAVVLVGGCGPGRQGTKLPPLPETAAVVPNLLGKTPEEAAEALAKNNLVLGRTITTADSTWAELSKPGLVVDQSETPGARLPNRSIVNVAVYMPTIPEYGEVPDVVGIKYADAVKMLKDAGFVPGEISKRHIIDTRRYDEVYRQSPEAGSVARRWTKINLGLYGPAQEGFVRVPRLTGLKAAEVPAVLEKLGLQQGTITFEQAPSMSFVGTVQGQSPAIGTTVKPGTKVDIVVYSE